MGVGVLRGNRCESQALNFSFALAKGEGPAEAGGRESTECGAMYAPFPPQACPQEQSSTSHPGRCECVTSLWHQLGTVAGREI